VQEEEWLKKRTTATLDPVRFSYNSFFSARFFSRNSVFLSQQISRNSVLACFFSEANGAKGWGFWEGRCRPRVVGLQWWRVTAARCRGHTPNPISSCFPRIEIGALEKKIVKPKGFRHQLWTMQRLRSSMHG